MAGATRSRLGQDERRAQLLELGGRLFTIRAYDEVSIDDIAASAGVSKGLLYHYFPSKRELYVATLQLNAGKLVEDITPKPDTPRDQRLVAGINAFLDHVGENSVGYSSLMRGGIGNDAEVAKVVDETRDAIIAIIFEGFGGGDPPVGLRLAARGWIGFMEAAGVEWAEKREVPRETMVAMATQVLQAALVSSRPS